MAELVKQARERGERPNLNDAKLNDAQLNYAQLNYAQLNYAQLNGVQLNGAELNGAELNRAQLNGAELVSLGFDLRGYHFLLRKEDDSLWITAGCRRFTLADARIHWNIAHADNPSLRGNILARLDMAEAIAKANGWIKGEESK